ncbi:diguanylate cyclase (GGDEF)-like protein [Halospina denitrificans]|uniref:diguanylate cyclase n=1 Tax=Halospina denitrificans TaxID=332522 RepID=A0A4R7K169_9GAMM|nr:sensor domain-containing diguanylate cyclase [Halospina denitrificans]TDT43179.1 diguanylate cyclase (GGDEF)-like protein [Halospina denitrificans]
MPEAFQQYPDHISLDALLEHARHNERIARTLFEIETEIMRLRDCATFVDCLVDRVRERFHLEEVWLVLTDIEANDNLLELLSENGALSLILRGETRDYLHLTQGSHKPVLVKDAQPYRRLIPSAWRETIKSMAILPLVMDDRLVGGLILGTSKAGRYQPDMDAFFLEQLAVKASIGLDSVHAREQLKRLATRDALTGLRNRREMETVLRKELSRSRRYHMPLSLLFIDCDGFKQVNDHYGHECGDAYLCLLADSLQHLLRADDSVFRFAGDEFVVVLPNQTVADATYIGERLQEHIEVQHLEWGNASIPVAFSLGAAGNEQPGMNDSRSLLRHAEQNLYEQKRRRANADLPDRHQASAPSTS